MASAEKRTDGDETFFAARGVRVWKSRRKRVIGEADASVNNRLLERNGSICLKRDRLTMRLCSALGRDTSAS